MQVPVGYDVPNGYPTRLHTIYSHLIVALYTMKASPLAGSVFELGPPEGLSGFGEMSPVLNCPRRYGSQLVSVVPFTGKQRPRDR